MTALTLLITVKSMLTAEGAIGKPFTVRLKRQVGTIKIIMTLNAELAFMTFVTELRISTRRNRMGDTELGTVNIGHSVAEFAHFVSTTGLVAIETVILLMTG